MTPQQLREYNRELNDMINPIVSVFPNYIGTYMGKTTPPWTIRRAYDYLPEGAEKITITLMGATC